MQQIVNIAEFKTSRSPQDVLVTYSLGSCLGVSFFDPEAGVGALGHFMLPLSSANAAKAAEQPAMFTDSGLTAMLEELFGLGARRARLVARVAGGASMYDDKNLFEIGRRNYTVLRKMLWKNNILISGEDVGGAKPRTMSLYMNGGVTTIKVNGQETIL